MSTMSMKSVLSIPFALWLVSNFAAHAARQTTPLDDLSLAGIKQGWGAPMAGVAVDGVPLRVAWTPNATGEVEWRIAF